LFSFFGSAFVCSFALLSGAGFSSRPTGLAVVVFFLFFHRFSCSSILNFRFFASFLRRRFLWLSDGFGGDVPVMQF
jgi:hypothetical protein